MSRKSRNDVALEAAAANRYTKSVSNGRIYYTDDFYFAMRMRLDSGLSPLEAYGALGYDVNALGEDRAYAAVGRASDPDVLAKKLHAVSGTVSMKDAEKASMNLAEEISYMKSRIAYLETVN